MSNHFGKVLTSRLKYGKLNLLNKTKKLGERKTQEYQFQESMHLKWTSFSLTYFSSSCSDRLPTSSELIPSSFSAVSWINRSWTIVMLVLNFSENNVNCVRTHCNSRAEKNGNNYKIFVFQWILKIFSAVFKW